ncbi:HIRAN domain-containing protein [uncultured Serinicoccus sp.]|uniref:HIRAN domain-containing protein n=1 Tax=uncultured Serinicoccus sp. TaxID=735514 RepID=UPI002614B4F0|nr:HIRAN domain-containing protein [uncultured Serinicoccus sp.]
MSKSEKSLSPAGALGFTVAAILTVGGLLTLFTEPTIAIVLLLGGGLIGWGSWLGRGPEGRSQRRDRESARTPINDATSWSVRYLPSPDNPEPTWRGSSEVERAFEVSSKQRDYHPPAPEGAPFEAWGSREEGVEVVGEFARPDSFRKLFRGDRGFRTEDGAEINDAALLLADPRNPYDKRAVAVFVRGQHVGYIPRGVAADYHSVVMNLQRHGHALQVRARTWAAIRTRTNGAKKVVARVRVYLPTEDQLHPDNGVPDEPHVPVPRGRKVQVTGEERHMDVLMPLLRQHGGAPVAAVLRSIVEQRPRSQVELVQVELSGTRVGVLSSTQSQNLMALVRGVEERGLLPVVRGELRGNEAKVNVALDVLRDHDEVLAWLQTLAGRTASSEAHAGGPE